MSELKQEPETTDQKLDRIIECWSIISQSLQIIAEAYKKPPVIENYDNWFHGRKKDE